MLPHGWHSGEFAELVPHSHMTPVQIWPPILQSLHIPLVSLGAPLSYHTPRMCVMVGQLFAVNCPCCVGEWENLVGEDENVG